jgi:urease accessory protein
MQFQGLSSSARDSGRNARAQLVAEFAGGRTVLRSQRVGYPLHITRGFYLDPSRPDVLTLYLQSASGGLYSGDRLALDVAVGEMAALHLTTQAYTVVHDGREAGAWQRQRVNVASAAFCAITTDPFVLFPGADLHLDTVATVAADAVLLVAEGFAIHDPEGSRRRFAQFSSRQRVLRPDGSVLLQDIGRLCGPDVGAGPLGNMAAAATVLIIAPPQKVASLSDVQEAADQCGCLAGASVAPNSAGVVVRILADDGGALARGLDAVFHIAARAAIGSQLARRRK